jgi:hypothetical protein
LTHLHGSWACLLGRFWRYSSLEFSQGEQVSEDGSPQFALPCLQASGSNTAQMYIGYTTSRYVLVSPLPLAIRPAACLGPPKLRENSRFGVDSARDLRQISRMNEETSCKCGIRDSCGLEQPCSSANAGQAIHQGKVVCPVSSAWLQCIQRLTPPGLTANLLS